ncbi:MAG: acyl-CoA thioesterase [Thermoleophilia bacterium]|nr:acyl-CoA thioesterase [Thermoleophilia bacterium]
MHEKRIEIRWRDLDALGHVNNGVYLTFLEEARDEWLDRVLGPEGRGRVYVLARVEIDYRRELTQADDAVVVRISLLQLGTSSLRTREEILTLDGGVAAAAEAVLVARDDDLGGSRPLEPRERALLERELP